MTEKYNPAATKACQVVKHHGFHQKHKERKKVNSIRIIFFACWLVYLEEVSSLHKGWARPIGDDLVQGCRALITSMIFFSVRYCLRLRLKMEVWERHRDRGQDPFCWPQPLCHGWPHPPKMARLHPRTEQDSRTPPTPAAIAACFTDLVQTRRIALHEPRTAIVPPSTGLLLEQVHESDISPTTSHSTGRLCITPIVVFLVVPLLW